MSPFSRSSKLQVSKIFRSSGQFVTGNNDGTVSLFNGSELIKTKDLHGTTVSVGSYNGKIVAAVENEKVTIMNESLRIINQFDRASDQISSICMNENYSAWCDLGGIVRYKRNGDMEPKVILLYYSIIQISLSFTDMMDP